MASKDTPTFPRTLLRSALLLLVMIIGQVSCDVAEDKRECEAPLLSLSSCLTFVGGDSKSPTSSCCSQLSKDYDNKRRCLCIVVRDRNDPNLGYKVNGTLALSLPYLCHVIHANVSDCPDLLRMDPNSPDAQIFLQFDSASAVKEISTSSSGDVKGSWVGLGKIGNVLLWMVIPIFF